MARAIQLELFYSKQEILEAYLNDAPYGRNVEGVGAASLAYFNTSAGSLSLPEALTLAVIPQDPTRRLQGANDMTVAGAGSNVINPQLAASRNRLYTPLAVWTSGGRCAQAAVCAAVKSAAVVATAVRRAAGGGASAGRASGRRR